LELGCRRGQDATTTIAVGEAAFRIDTVGSLSIGKPGGLANPVLAISKLYNALVEASWRVKGGGER
jgi:hypothetical protein